MKRYRLELNGGYVSFTPHKRNREEWTIYELEGMIDFLQHIVEAKKGVKP